MHIPIDAAACDIYNAAKYIICDCPSDSAFMDRIILLTFLGAHKPDLSLKFISLLNSDLVGCNENYYARGVPLTNCLTEVVSSIHEVHGAFLNLTMDSV